MTMTKEKAGRRHSPEKSLVLASWGFFLIWTAIVKLGGYGSGAVLLGAGIILILCQGVRRLLSLPVEGRWLLAGILLFSAGLWRSIGADLQLLPLILLGAGVAFLVSSWRGLVKGR